MTNTKKARKMQDKLETELKGLFAATAVVMNECFYPSSGNRMLGLSEDKSLFGALDLVELDKTNIGRYLSIYYAYAYEGRLIPGYENEVNLMDDNIEKLIDFVNFFKTDDPYFELCLDVVGIDTNEDTGHLNDMVAHLSARNSLDEGYSLSIVDIAILAGMNERSVKNALTADEENRLTLNAAGDIDNDVAKNWLKGRRGFIATQKRNYPESLLDCPDQLDALEIPSFVANRIEKKFGEYPFDKVALATSSSPDFDDAYVDYPEVIQRAAKIAELPNSVVQSAMQQPLRIKPEDCLGLAKAISVDPVWFTMQVMRAIYPLQMDMLLNPTYYNSADEDAQLEGTSVDIVLTEAMIKHGYLDIPAYAKELFPSDCFGSREENGTGTDITLRYGSQEVLSDIRIKSEKTISPRKRFTAWFQKEVFAAAGDRVRITKVDDRIFQLIHQPK